MKLMTHVVGLTCMLALLTGVTALGRQAVVTCGGSVATDSTLFGELWGFGGATTGGLGGQVYVVTRTDDPSPAVCGTLRYGVESLQGPTWIVFDELVFPASTKRSIYLNSTLRVRSNLTIDGRGSHVSLRRRYYLDEADWTRTASGVYECELEPGHAHEAGPIIEVRSVKNVIVTHLDFLQEYRNVADEPNIPPASDHTGLDKQCFGDVINIANRGNVEDEYDNIWINRSEFTNCADECIGITRPNSQRRAYLTISGNLFTWSFKGILLGGLDIDPPFRIAATMYGNRFVGVHMRQPRVGKAYAHVFNNVYEDWTGTAVKAHSYSRVILEHNVARPVSQVTNWWAIDPVAVDASLWAKNTVSSVPGPFSTSTFPACGFAWYYPCGVQKIDISRMTYTAARDRLRPLSGWQNVFNDVR